MRVAENQRDAARFSLFHALKADYRGCERVVRINGLDLPYWKEDIPDAERYKIYGFIMDSTTGGELSEVSKQVSAVKSRQIRKKGEKEEKYKTSKTDYYKLLLHFTIILMAYRKSMI